MVHDGLIQQAGRAEGEEDAANEDGPANYEPAGMRAHGVDGTLAQACLHNLILQPCSFIRDEASQQLLLAAS